MSQKEYLSVDYICQELRRSINDYLSGKAGGVINSSYTFHSVINEGEIRYSIAGLNAVLCIKRHGKGENYNLHEIIKNNHDEVYNENIVIKPERSSTHRISGNYLKKFAEERLQNLRAAKKSHGK